MSTGKASSPASSRFKAFLDHALDMGADYIATGHYARVACDDGCRLLKARDENKDQTYFLYMLGQRALSHSLFPLGDYSKPRVREMAREAGFGNYRKKDSTGICFIGERRFAEFVRRWLPPRPGEIRTLDGEVVGRHQGVAFYTLGQRHGLGIGGRRGAGAGPWYVVDKDPEANVLYVAQGHDHPRLLSRGLVATELAWVSGEPPRLPWEGHARVRYRQREVPCRVEAAGPGRCRVRFAEPQRAVTPGQYVVFYEGERCLGGGKIERALP